MGGFKNYGGKVGWELISWIKEGTACKTSGFSLDEFMRYEERIPLDLKLGGISHEFRQYESVRCLEVLSLGLIQARIHVLVGSKPINQSLCSYAGHFLHAGYHIYPFSHFGKPDQKVVTAQTSNHLSSFLTFSYVDHPTFPPLDCISPTCIFSNVTPISSLQLVQMLQPRQHNLLTRLLNLASQKHFI